MSEEKNMNKFKFFLMFLLAGLLICFLSYYIFYKEIFVSNNVQVLKAEKGPIKIIPKNLEGNKIIGKDLTVIDLIDINKNKSDGKEIIKLKSDKQSPELPPVNINKKEILNKIDKKKNLQNKIENKNNTQTKSNNLNTREIENKNENKINKEKLLMAQVAAFRNKEKAEIAAALLSEKHKKRLNSYFFEVIKFKNSNVDWWRVITKPIPASKAEEICNLLRKSGQDCILRKEIRN